MIKLKFPNKILIFFPLVSMIICFKFNLLFPSERKSVKEKNLCKHPQIKATISAYLHTFGHSHHCPTSFVAFMLHFAIIDDVKFPFPRSLAIYFGEQLVHERPN